MVSGTNNNGGPAAATTKHELIIGGEVIPDPPPKPDPKPDPPQPLPQTVAVAVLLIESADLTPAQAAMINDLRNRITSKRVLVLDKDAKTSGGQPVSQAVAAVKHIGSKPLPRLVGLDSSGVGVLDAEVPKTAAEALAALAQWGIAP